MKTLKHFCLFLAAVMAVFVTLFAFKQGAWLPGAITGYAIYFAASHALQSWSNYDARIFRASLSFPITEAGKPKGARLLDRGCLSCPTGTAFTSDTALNTLEAVTNNVLLQGVKEWKSPSFPLESRPIRAAQFQEMTGNRRYTYHAFYQQPQRAKFYDPTPDRQTFTITRELLDQCGGDVVAARMIANANTIGCAPPRGPRGLTGKDVYGQTAAHTVAELGPFCITDFFELRDFQLMLEAYKRGAINYMSMALAYEKMRNYVAMSRNNGVAIAGTYKPSFVASTFRNIPDSTGSIEWLLAAIDHGIGGEIDPGMTVEVNVSRQTFEYWLMQYKVDNDIELRTDPSQLLLQLKGYITAFDETGALTIQSRRTNRKVRINTSREPVYVEMTVNGNAGEWDFQEYFKTELGDDSDTSQGQGFRQSMNTAYGDACTYCNGQPKVLVELIFIYADSAFHYEAFPTNPLRSQIPAGVEANMQALWGGMEIEWYFGTAVDIYFLQEMNTMLAGTGAPCFNNRDNTWFAGRLKGGLQFVEDQPRQMMTLAVRVPGAKTPIKKSDGCCVPCTEPDAITITARPGQDPKLCTDIPAAEADDLPAGCMLAPSRLQFQLPCEGNLTIPMVFQRRGGTTGTLTVPFTITDGTALEGAGADKHFLLADGNIVFADGDDTAQKNIVLHPFRREAGDPKFVQAVMNYDNDPEVLCEDSPATTKLCFALCDQIAGDAADECPAAYCLACADVPTVPAE